MPLREADVRRLEQATGRPREAFVEEADGWWVLKGTGTEGGCVFLGTVEVAGRRVRGCTAHAARPEACRHYPFILQDLDPQPDVTRDPLCPFRGDFAPSEGVREALLTLERQLDEERRGRPGVHDR